ncbi:MAG: hypothetical protein HKN23_11675 [Verrucomicrobiales bacterium]|nr:hypothetical protein [Verrucomicrobiales bacterium]
MENEEGEIEIPREPIPEVLYSFYEERPFRICTRCGESLPEFDEGYRVSKLFKKGEVLMEYALCFPCLEAMMDETSEESKKRLNKFQAERFRNVSGFNDCNLCERTRDQARGDEYSLVGICQANDMLDSGMICIECMEEMAELVSEETRRNWDKFKEENFPGVPADFAPSPVPGPVHRTPVTT